MHYALRHAHPRQPAARARALVQRQQQRFAFVGQQLRIGQRAGRDHAHHFALHRPFGCADFTDLLAYRHRFAQLDEPRQVGF